ncbi:hypothetical protein [Cystobacter fuscus]|uniref:hypothetical protein n=1 Tax=Cystobacter fuscus TaxID=43 RepID=UPI002B2DA6DB|nr:hypothetical protein F0U63_29505 [Cystobacter fuscus]
MDGLHVGLPAPVARKGRRTPDAALGLIHRRATKDRSDVEIGWRRRGEGRTPSAANPDHLDGLEVREACQSLGAERLREWLGDKSTTARSPHVVPEALAVQLQFAAPGWQPRPHPNEGATARAPGGITQIVLSHGLEGGVVAGAKGMPEHEETGGSITGLRTHGETSHARNAGCERAKKRLELLRGHGFVGVEPIDDLFIDLPVSVLVATVGGFVDGTGDET